VTNAHTRKNYIKHKKKHISVYVYFYYTAISGYIKSKMATMRLDWR